MRRFIPLLLALALLPFAPSRAGAITFDDLRGRWSLMYRGNFGYEFRFGGNYSALCILYLQTNILIFKGVYTIEQGNRVRINISDMKNQDGGSLGSLQQGFTRISSSYFVFRGEKRTAQGRPVIDFYPVEIMINGNSSEGYFEPVLRLTRQ